MEKRKGQEWTKDEDRQLKDLFNKGYSYEFIANKLDRTWFGVKCRMQRVKLIPEEGFTKEFKNSTERFVCPRDKYNKYNVNSEEKQPIQTNELQYVLTYLIHRYNMYNEAYVLSDYLVGGSEAKRQSEAMLHEIKIVKQLMNMTVEQRKEVMQKDL